MMLIITSLFKVKNEWICTFPPLLCLYGLEQENIPFLLLFVNTLIAVHMQLTLILLMWRIW